MIKCVNHLINGNEIFIILKQGYASENITVGKSNLKSYFLFLTIQIIVCSVVLFDTFVNILAHNLAEPAYEADVAQLEYKLVAGEHGLIIRVKGFNHKLPVSVSAFVSSEKMALLS